jgi:LmbE family N-acetylglucosaminyl deacetylase
MDLQTTAAIFYFAHQDDECGVFQLIKDELQSGAQVYCFYYTSGTFSGLSSIERNNESISILTKLGVNSNRIHFIGGENKIPDCRLVDHLDFIFRDISNVLNSVQFRSRIFVPAWEGGHPDHDALHVATVMASKKNNLLEQTFQYALYNGFKCPGSLFRVLSPLKENGRVFAKKIPVSLRLRYLSYCLRYPSQRKSWVGLFPFFVYHYVFHGLQTWQHVSLERLFMRQHNGPLYFSKRKFYDENLFFKKINFFLSENIKLINKN